MASKVKFEGLSREMIALRVSREIKEGSYVNLGIGIRHWSAIGLKVWMWRSRLRSVCSSPGRWQMAMMFDQD